MNRWLYSLLLFGAFFVVGLILWVRAYLRSKWLIADGMIIGSKIVETYFRGTHYSLEIKYRYKINGRNYINQVRKTKAFFNSQRSAEELRGIYHQGVEVPVYYDPQKPDSSVLERSTGYALLLLIASGTAFLMTGVIILVKPN